MITYRNSELDLPIGCSSYAWQVQIWYLIRPFRCQTFLGPYHFLNICSPKFIPNTNTTNMCFQKKLQFQTFWGFFFFFVFNEMYFSRRVLKKIKKYETSCWHTQSVALAMLKSFNCGIADAENHMTSKAKEQGRAQRVY